MDEEPRSIPWDEESPSCPNCGSDWIDEDNMYSCFSCGWFSMKTDIEITDCERCGRQFLYEVLAEWSMGDSEHSEEYLLCPDCLTAVFVHGDLDWKR